MDRYLPLDEEGYFIFDGRRVDDEELGREMLENLKFSGKHELLTSLKGEPAFVEAFDAPLIARHLGAMKDGLGEMDLAYQTKMKFPLSSLSVDEWDRFHGFSESGVPFVLSRTAQMEFFDKLDSFDDESVTIQGQRYETPPWLLPNTAVEKDAWWNKLYDDQETPWDLGTEAPALPVILPQLKLTPSRVLVLGCGAGHDAAYFAQQGHIVTGVDFSDEALTRARAKYGEQRNLTLLKADAFALPEKMDGQFDLIFEHTCYAAIDPARRSELVKVWTRALQPRGELLGIFFVHEKRSGPPTGGSEWELKNRLRERFDFTYWTRWRASSENRRGKELVVFARRKN